MTREQSIAFTNAIYWQEHAERLYREAREMRGDFYASDGDEEDDRPCECVNCKINRQEDAADAWKQARRFLEESGEQ